MLSKTETWNSLGECKITQMKYPVDYPNGTMNEPVSQAISMLKDRHMIDVIVEKMNLKQYSPSDIRLLSSSIVTDSISSFGQKTIVNPKHLFVSNLTSPLQNYSPSTISNGTFQFNQNIFRKEATMDSYDQFDRVSQSHKEDDINTSFIWGYNHQFQVIVAKNVDHPTLEVAVNSLKSNFDAFLFSLGNLSDPAKKIEWASFNTSLRALLPQDARIVTYTFVPLIGISSKTDQNGITTYFYYDDFGRLSYEKDSDNNIVKKYDYHYQGQ